MTKSRLADCPSLHKDCPNYEVIKRLEQRIAELTSQLQIDELTGLYNKRHLGSALLTEMERSKRHKHPMSVIIFDLDHFKSINDTYGHPFGDRVLKAVASVVKTNLRITDIPCRYGGEEFVIILPSTPLLLAAQAAERLRSAIAIEYLGLPDSEETKLNITASFGVAGYLPNAHETPEVLIDRADRQLYLAKESGRNQVHYEPVTQTVSSQVSHEEREPLFKADDTED